MKRAQRGPWQGTQLTPRCPSHPPSHLRVPMGQYSHSVFNEKETMPASHRVQLCEPRLLAYVPLGHGVHSCDPTMSLKKPMPQGWHSGPK